MAEDGYNPAEDCEAEAEAIAHILAGRGIRWGEVRIVLRDGHAASVVIGMRHHPRRKKGPDEKPD